MQLNKYLGRVYELRTRLKRDREHNERIKREY